MRHKVNGSNHQGHSEGCGRFAATVSLALNNSKLASANTARRVKEAAERMGYVRNMFARSLAKGAARWICAAKASSALISGLYDGLIASIAPVPLTTINPNLPAIAKGAIDAVRRAIGGEQL